MDRRTFMALCSATGAQLIAPTVESRLAPRENYARRFAGIFPPMPAVRALAVLDLGDSVPWEDVVLLTSLQGLINRREPRIYLAHDETDQFWLDYYRDRYGIATRRLGSVDALFDEFANEVNGCVVYDETMLDSANVATTLAGIENLLPVTSSQLPQLERFGLRPVHNLLGRWKDRYDAYRWARGHLWPKCNRQLLGAACVDRPLWPSNSVWLRDYLIAHTVFTFDLSASLRDRRDLELLASIFRLVSGPACVMGWRCCRCNEHEFVGLAARHDIAVLSATDVRNLTVHAAIPRNAEPFRQDHLSDADVGEVGRNVYISFMATDGDAMSSMLRLQAGRFHDPEHGQIPFAYGFLPAACDLMPGVAACNFERKAKNDYFVAPSSGAMYTYPYLMPNARGYLRATREYLRRADLRVAYMINWDDDFWWQEMDLPKFLPMLRKELPECIGFLRGQGESPFERQYIGDGVPYLFSGEGLHRDSDVHATFREFIDANPIRPLFIYCLSNHTVSLGRIIEGIGRLQDKSIRIVRLDEFIGLVNKALKTGLVPPDDFYPDKTRLRLLMQEEARRQWPGILEHIRSHADLTRLDEAGFREAADDPLVRMVLDRSATPPADLVAHTAIWDSMTLAKVALNRRGVYVNEKAKAVDDYMREFGSVEGAGVMRQLWKNWVSWRSRKLDYRAASSLARQLHSHAESLDRMFDAPNAPL